MIQRVLRAAAVAVTTIPFAAGAALALAPDNDSVSAAQVVEAPLPWVWTQDTSEATTEPVDEIVWANGCGLSIDLLGTVWFTYTDIDGDGFGVDVTGSDFLASVAIVEGEPATGSVVACAEGRVAARGSAGQTYSIMVFSDRPSVNGGRLEMTVQPLRPAPTSTLTVDPVATANGDGSLRVSGTYSCANADGYNSSIRGQVDPRGRRDEQSGFFFVPNLTCDGEVYSWATLATNQAGVFPGGTLASTSTIFASGDLQVSVTEVPQQIRVIRSR